MHCLKLFFVFIFLTTTVSSAIAFNNEPIGFRDGIWGQSPEEIDGIEKQERQPYGDANNVLYSITYYTPRAKTKIGGYDFKDLFSKFKIVRGKESFYQVEATMVNIREYSGMLKVLEEKFGKHTDFEKIENLECYSEKYIWKGKKTQIVFHVDLPYKDQRPMLSNMGAGMYAGLVITDASSIDKIDTSGF